MEKVAFIFDMDGTLIDNMPFHQQAWQKIVDELQGGLKGNALKVQLYGKNEEVLKRVFGPGRFSSRQLKKISQRKENYYRELYESQIKPIAGLERFLRGAFELKIPMALATASNIPNVNLLLDALKIRSFF